MYDYKKIKICFLAAQLGCGGAERQLYFILSALKKKGATLLLLTKTKGQFWEERIKDLGVNVKWIGSRNSKFKRIMNIITEVKKFRPDIIQSQHFHMNVYSAIAGKLSGAYVIGASRNDIFSEIRATGKILGYMNLKTPEAIVANSKKAIKNAISLGISKRKLFYLPNVIDTNYFKPQKKKDGQLVQIIGAGSLWKPKRFDRFLRVIDCLKRYNPPEFKAKIVGDGPLKNQLEKQASELNLLGNTVEFIGNVSDIKPHYNDSDIFMHTADHEGTPNVILEAMACGLPVVSTNVGGVSGIIKNEKMGFLFNPSDEKGITEKLHCLICDSKLRGIIGKNARNYIYENFCLNKLPDKLEILYREIFNSKF